MTMREHLLLERAWALASQPSTGQAYIAEAHGLMSHPDSSSCDGGWGCSIDADGLLMFELAHEVVAMQGSFEELLQAWETDGRRIADRNAIVSFELDKLEEAV